MVRKCFSYESNAAIRIVLSTAEIPMYCIKSVHSLVMRVCVDGVNCVCIHLQMCMCVLGVLNK